MKSQLKYFSLIAGLAAFSAGTISMNGADKAKPKYTVSEVMKAVHKGEDNIAKRVVKGTASKEDIATMMAYYESLPLNDPPKGDKQDWAAKTGKLLAAAKAVQAGKPHAAEQFKEAANCKACHDAHKEKKQG